MALIFEIAAQGLQMFLVLTVAPLMLGITRKVKARLLRRIGPPIIQPYRDLWKLMHKEAVLAHNASWLYRVVPYLLFATTWVAAALIPTYSTGLIFSWSADIIAIVALLATGRFLTIVPRSVLRFSSKPASIKELPTELPVTGPVGLLTVRKRALSPAGQLFIQCARAIANAPARRH